MSPSAAVLAGDQRHPLVTGGEPVVLGAGTVVVEVSDVDRSVPIRFDGRARSVSYDATTRRATFAVDLARDTGFHELLVESHSFVFATDDAKLRLDGIRDLLDYLASTALSWSGAMFFSGTDQVLRDDRLDRAWLERHGPEIVSVGRAIADAPWAIPATRRRRSDRGVPDVGSTMRLLRQRPDLLEELDGGPVEFEHPDGALKTYAPREVIIRERIRTLDTPGNRRATALLEGTSELAMRVAAAAPSKELAHALTQLSAELEELLARAPFRDLRRRRAHMRLASREGVEERLDYRYRQVGALHADLFDVRHWDPQRALLPERAYVGYADSIYQQFCGQVLADHLGLTATGTPPGSEPGPHFTGDRFDLYLDVKPPAALLRDWRDKSTRPTDRRPDLVLHERASGRTALMDAKYRAKGTRASDDSLGEVQLYLQAYSRQRIGVLFPAGAGDPSERWRIHEVTDGHFSIYELPITGEPELASFLDTQLEPLLELLLAA